MKLTHLLILTLITAAIACAEDKTTGKTEKPKEKDPKTMTSNKVMKSEEEWRKLLTPEQFAVTRTAATERAFGKAYEEFNKQGDGTYYCVACGAELFTSSEKFHSGCGWPSFYDASKAKNVAERRDEDGSGRIEVVCTRCDSHLGHVFEKEGFKTPTNRRFCINGVALKFVEKGGAAPKLEETSSDKVKASKAEIKKAAGE